MSCLSARNQSLPAGRLSGTRGQFLVGGVVFLAILMVTVQAMVWWSDRETVWTHKEQQSTTAFYLAVYIVTLVIHLVFMNYVLAGSAYLSTRTLLLQHPRDPLADMLRDWLPFALSGAITAGVAPLLFIQVLYKKQFYTANLLLFGRWMARMRI